MTPDACANSSVEERLGDAHRHGVQRGLLQLELHSAERDLLADDDLDVAPLDLEVATMRRTLDTGSINAL